MLFVLFKTAINIHTKRLNQLTTNGLIMPIRLGWY